MAGVREKVSEDVRNAITRVLHDNLRLHGFQGAMITDGLDHDGDPVIFVEAQFDLVPEPIDPAITFGITQQVRDAIGELGETRVPNIRYKFLDDQVVAPRRKRKRA